MTYKRRWSIVRIPFAEGFPLRQLGASRVDFRQIGSLERLLNVRYAIAEALQIAQHLIN
jgi:hypothetical protein